MPYNGIPSDKTDIMDRCVGKVMGTGRSKDSAIAICHDSIMGKKEITEKEWEEMSEAQVLSVIDETLDAWAEEHTKQIELEEKSVLSTEQRNKLPDSAFLYIDDSGERHLPYKTASGAIDLVHLRNAIARIPQMKGVSDSVKKRLQSRARKLLENAKKELGIEDEGDVVDRIVSAIKSLLKVEDDSAASPISIWKEANGTYRWLARYSNNFRDNDNPPEIISEASHKRFVDKVDKGEFAPPELWLWHRPEWKCGRATAVAYDDTGFAVATGYFDKGKEFVAEWLSKQKNVAVSHAMPPGSIARDTEDPSVIVEHRTVEISPLPLWAAANKLTGFIVVQDAQKEADMAIPEKKRETFIKEWGIDPTLLDSLEQQNAADAEKALSDGRESKEQSEQVAEGKDEKAQETPVSEQVSEAIENNAADDKPEQDGDALDQSPSRREIADAFGSILGEMKDTLKSIADRIDGLEKEVKEVKADQTEKVEKAAGELPAASLGALLAHRMIGRQETVVDGRSSLAKSKPKEAEDAHQKTGIPFVDRMIGINQD